VIRYPKVYRSRSVQRAVVIRPATSDDVEALLKFFNDLPEEDRLHLRVDVTQREVMKRRMSPSPHWTVVRLIGLFGDRIVGEASLFESHVGEIRLLVAREFRGTGLASYIGRQIFAHAINMGIEKIEGQMMEDEEHSVRCLESLGFEREGVLRNFVKDIKGNHHNLLIMSLRT
jgi:RimJ/RimL family protein N-acetyltransferase